MRFLKWLTLPWALCVAGAVFIGAQFSEAARSGAQEQSSTLEQEIADIERQIDEIEGQAIVGIPSLLPGSPERLPALGKILFFDKELSINRNEACALCRTARLGKNALQFEEGSKRGLCRVLTAALLCGQARRRKMHPLLYRR